MIDFHSQVIQAIQEAQSARADLRQLLTSFAGDHLELTTELDYRRAGSRHRQVAGGCAWTVDRTCGAKRFTLSQREAELKLAKAYRIAGRHRRRGLWHPRLAWTGQP